VCAIVLEQYRGTNEAATLEKLSMWDDIADKDIAEQTFTDSLNHMFDSLLELRQDPTSTVFQGLLLHLSRDTVLKVARWSDLAAPDTYLHRLAQPYV
jgi:hypothetical protein